MRLVCPSCSAVADVASELAPRCSACGVALRAHRADASPSRASIEVWFIEDGEGVQRGPYDADELAVMFDRQQLCWTDRVWRDGLRDFRAARKDDALVVALANARGLDRETTRLDMLPRLLGADPPRQSEDACPVMGDATLVVESSVDHELRSFAAEPPSEGPGLREEDTAVDSAPTAPSASTPVGSPSAAAHSLPPPPSRLYAAARYFRLTTLALLAFMGGALAVSIATRITSFQQPREAHAAPRTQPAPVAARAPEPEPAVATRAEPFEEVVRHPRPARSKEVVRRSLPALEEVKRELKRLGPHVRDCVPEPRLGVEVELVIAGTTGRVRQSEVRSPALTPGCLECTKAALEELRVPPFVSDELLYRHRFKW